MTARNKVIILGFLVVLILGYTAYKGIIKTPFAELVGVIEPTDSPISDVDGVLAAKIGPINFSEYVDPACEKGILLNNEVLLGFREIMARLEAIE